MSPRGVDRQPPDCRPSVAGSGPRALVGGVSAREIQDPTRLPRSRFEGSIVVRRVRREPPPRGLRRPFDPCTPVAPLLRWERPSAPSGLWAFSFARRHALVRPCGFPRSSRQDASKPLLQPTFRVTSTRFWNITSGDSPPGSRGKTRQRSTSRDVLGWGRFRLLVLGRRRTTSRSSGLRRLRA